MNGDRPTANGEHVPNGILPTAPASTLPVPPVGQDKATRNLPTSSAESASVNANGASHRSRTQNGVLPSSTAGRLEDAPAEVMQLVSIDHYLPMATLVSRTTQTCWNAISNLVDDLASRPVSAFGELTKEQERANQEKKDLILRFAEDQKADFIKILVLLDWSKNAKNVDKTINLNTWIWARRSAYWTAIAAMAQLKLDATAMQLPNPDLATAAELLSRGKVSSLPDLGYIPREDLSAKQMLRLLKTLNRLLTVKLVLTDEIPQQLRKYRIRDGRATFVVENEFELDASLLSDTPDAQLRVVDFRFTFSPAPSIPSRFKDEIEVRANSNLDHDGLEGCYFFLHELTLSYKLAEYHKQAWELARGQWAGSLRVEMVRRNLIIQYWSTRQAEKNWIEIGIRSGRERAKAADGVADPFLHVRWMRHGKEVELFELADQKSNLFLEGILHQVIAQHSTFILDGIYDRLIQTPLFADAELTLDQELSYQDPEACSLAIGLSKHKTLQLRVDPITGTTMATPVTERSERLQTDLNQRQATPGEIGSRLLTFRCTTAETAVMTGINVSCWEVQSAFRPNGIEAKALFGDVMVRANFFRQKAWGTKYLFAVTHAHEGDKWWLFEQVAENDASVSSRNRLIHSQRIGVEDDLSPAYFERLAEYTSGLICLQCNARYLTEQEKKFELAPFPTFGPSYTLPRLSFDLESLQQSHGEGKSNGSKVQVGFAGIDRETGLASMVAKFVYPASSTVLKRCNAFALDANITLSPEDGTVTIRDETKVGVPAISKLVETSSYLTNIISTVEQIQRLPGFHLKAVSRATFILIYRHAPPTELALKMTFGAAGSPPQVDFSPSESNPHTLLKSQVSKIFSDDRSPFSSKVSSFLSALTLTYPLVSHLFDLQNKIGVPNEATSTEIDEPDAKLLRIHVIVRNATSYGLQYFTPAARPAGDGRPEAALQMVARFEIVHSIHSSGKSVWLVRPALQDFQSYSRPSYSSPELQQKLRQEVFMKSNDTKEWMGLDSAAICLVDRPGALLQAIHNVLLSWVKQQDKLEEKVKVETKTGPAAGVPNGTNRPKPQLGGTIQAPGKPNQAANGAPNQQRAKVNPVKPTPNAKIGNMGANKKHEVITLD